MQEIQESPVQSVEDYEQELKNKTDRELAQSLADAESIKLNSAKIAILGILVVAASTYGFHSTDNEAAKDAALAVVTAAGIAAGVGGLMYYFAKETGNHIRQEVNKRGLKIRNH